MTPFSHVPSVVNYPFISAFHRIEDEYDLEIYLAGKDEEVAT